MTCHMTCATASKFGGSGRDQWLPRFGGVHNAKGCKAGNRKDRIPEFELLC